MAQEINCWLEEGAFAEFGIQFVLPQNLQDLPQVLLMFFRGFAEYQDVIQVDNDTPIQEGMEDVIHELHEGGWCICQTKWHDSKFEVAVASAEGCLWNVLFCYAYLVIAAAQVNFGEDFGTLNSVQELINAGQWISVS